MHFVTAWSMERGSPGSPLSVLQVHHLMTISQDGSPSDRFTRSPSDAPSCAVLQVNSIPVFQESDFRFVMKENGVAGTTLRVGPVSPAIAVG